MNGHVLARHSASSSRRGDETLRLSLRAGFSSVLRFLGRHISSILGTLRYYWKLNYRYEFGLMLYVLLFGYLDQQIIVQLPPYVNNQVISASTGVYITVEGVLLGLTPQIKRKYSKDVLVVVATTGILASVSMFITTTFQIVQLSYLSFAPTTLQFQLNSFLFFALVELYAATILLSDVKKNPFKAEPDWQVT